MFENYNELISIDKVLKDSYNYDFNGNLADLLQQNFIEVEGNGVDALFWIFYQGEKYLFKPINDATYNVWGEILSSYLAEYLNIPHVNYRIATFDGKMGVISKSMIKGKEKLILGSELIQDFYNYYPSNKNGSYKLYEIPSDFLELNSHELKKAVFNYLNNLDSLSSMVDAFPNLSDEEKINIIKGVKLTLIFDIISLQTDRHPDNWGVTKKDVYEYALLFDNSSSFGLGYFNVQDRVVNLPYRLFSAKKSADFRGIDEGEELKNIIYDRCPNLVYSTDDAIDPVKRKNKTIPEVLEHFLKQASSEERDEAISIILSVDSPLIENIIKKAEEENHLLMDEQLKMYVLTLFDNHLNIIHEVANKYRRSRNDIRK